MSKFTLINEIKKISLSEKQQIKIELHFNNIVQLAKDVGINNVVKLGSLGRDSELAINENSGFLLSIALRITGHNIYKGEELFDKIKKRLNLIYIKNEKINLTNNSIEIIFDDSLTIEILLVYKNNTAEFVYNTITKNWDHYFMYSFNELFNNSNKKAFNALSDISIIYKYIKKQTVKIQFNNTSFEMLLYSSLIIEDDWERTIKSTMANFISKFRKLVIDNNFSSINNPVLNAKPIESKLITTIQASYILCLNDFVSSAISNAIDNGLTFDNLQRRYDILYDKGKFYTIDL